MKGARVGLCFLAACLVAGLGAAGLPKKAGHTQTWSPKAAAAYLEYREAWWASWPRAKRGQGTWCVSCHAGAPYALARPALRAALGEKAPSTNENYLIENVRNRVRLWKVVAAYFPVEPGESRGSESVLDALVLSSYDARNGRLSESTRAAFGHMWGLQLTSGEAQGAWPWLSLKSEPWEAQDSQYYGAALAAVAVGMAPEQYRSTPGIQKNLNLLREYLNREFAKQSLFNRVVALWASAKLPGVLSQSQQQSMISEVLSKQRGDGGWCLASLGGPWKRADGTPLVMKSDGYATGLILFALQQAGMKSDRPQLEQGLDWLVLNQDKTGGGWIAYSLNHHTDLSSDTGRFMSDAATAFAVMALTQAHNY